LQKPLHSQANKPNNGTSEKNNPVNTK